MKKTQRNRTQPAIRAKFDRRSGIVRLNVPLSVKADSISKDARTFTGLAATWQEDLGQDVIQKGAFKQSIKDWKASSEALPLLNSHDHFDIFSALGQALSMKETDQGLEIDWEVIKGDDGDRVLERLRPSDRTGRALIGKMSIGFIPTKFSYEQPAGTESFFDRIRHITEAELKEVSLVLFPMNPGASIDATSVKSFMQLARDTDPTKLDSITRMELRRLNTRIGLLLKKQKPEDEAEHEESEDTQEQPSTQPPSTPKARTGTADSDDHTDDTDELDALAEDLVDDDDLGVDGDEGDDADDSEDTEQSDEKSTSTDTTKEKKDEPQQYLYTEALKQRLAKVTLQRRVGEAFAVRDDD